LVRKPVYTPYNQRPHAWIGRSVEMYLFKTGCGGIVNIDGDRATVAMVTTPEVAHTAQIDFHAFLNSTFLSNPTARTRLDMPRPVGEISSAFPINPAVHHHNHHAAFLVGDAQRTVEPFSGEGVFFALQDGLSIAERLLALIQCSSSVRLHDRRSRFWINQVVSPVLQRSNIFDRLIVIGRQLPTLVSLAAKSILDRIEVSQ